MSMMVSFCAVFFFPRGVLDEILNLIESVSEGFSFLLLVQFRFTKFAIGGIGRIRLGLSCFTIL